MQNSFHADADSAMAAGQIGRAIGCLEAAAAADPQDFDAWMKLAALRRASGNGRGALDAVNAALGARPNEFLSLLLKANLHEQLGEIGRAAEIYRAALFHAADHPQLPPPILRQLDHAREFLAVHRAGIEAAMPVLAELGAEHAARARRFLENVLDRRTIYTQQPTHYHYPGQPDIEYFDFAHQDLRQRLRDAYPAIRAEFEALAADLPDLKRPYVDFAPGQPMAQWAPLNKSPAWNTFHLVRYGDVDPQIAGACPETMKLFAGADQPDIPGLTPNLMFSLLAPRTRIPAHVGVANFRAVLHLPIIVPGQCFFRVGSDTREWKEGEPWIFDDTIEHEAWNDSDRLRVVLIGDLWRPGLDQTDRQIIRELLTAQTFAGDLGAL